MDKYDANTRRKYGWQRKYKYEISVMENYKLSHLLYFVLDKTIDFLEDVDRRYITPEALLLIMFARVDNVKNIFEDMYGDSEEFKAYLYRVIFNIDAKFHSNEVIESYDFKRIFEKANEIAAKDNSTFIRVKDILPAILDIEDNYIEDYLTNVKLCDINKLKEAYSQASFGIGDTIDSKEDDAEDVPSKKKTLDYAVKFWDDDESDGYVVCKILESIFYISKYDVDDIIDFIEKNGSGEIGVYSRDIAYTKRDEALNYAKEKGCNTLKITIEPKYDERESDI
jgi:ATP-dependent Clp protease adapter protein ClpS/histone H3/H4